MVYTMFCMFSMIIQQGMMVEVAVCVCSDLTE